MDPRREPDLSGWRVLHVVQKFSSGVAAAITEYTRSLPEVEHHLLAGTPEDIEEDPVRLACFARIHRMDGGAVARIRRVRAVVREVRPDVVHAHSSHGGGFARLAVPRTRQHLVYTPHCYAFERRDVSPLVRAGFWTAEALLALNTSSFAACSPREQALSAWPLGRAPRHLVPNIPPAAPGTARPVHHEPIVLGGGRLSEQKDPGFFLDCLAGLRAARPGLRAVWLGDGDARYRAALRAAGVELTGWLPRNRAVDLLSRSGLYLHSARWEGFPVMVAEAVASGVPVLVRPLPCFAGVPRELMLEGPDDLSAAWACLHDPERAAANVAGWAGVLHRHTRERQRAALIDVYTNRSTRDGRLPAAPPAAGDAGRPHGKGEGQMDRTHSLPHPRPDRWVHDGVVTAYLRDLGVTPLPSRTVPFDPGYDAPTVISHIALSGHLMGGLKLSMACWQIASQTEVQRKIDAARSHGVSLIAGGGSFEIASRHGLLDEYFELCAGLGITCVEAGEGFTELTRSAAEVLDVARSHGLELQFELGRKHEGVFDAPRIAELVDQGKEWLDAGAVRLVIEARESAAEIGLFAADGSFRGDLADALADGLGLDNVCFETPTKPSQFAVLQHFGPEVWLSNVRLEELLRVEIYRRGLHADSYGDPQLCPWAVPAPVELQKA